VPIGLVWGKRPFLKRGAPTILGKPEHPQVAPGSAPANPVPDQDAHDSDWPVHRQYVTRHGELLVRTVPLALPEPCDRLETLQGLRPGGGEVRSVLDEQLG
jgi:hypothetical protein